MQSEQKQRIKQLFEDKRKRLGMSQQRAAVAAGTKGSTISQVFSGKYKADDTAVYRLLARWVEYDEQGWQLAETVNYGLITRLLEDAAQHGNAYALVGNAGCGKTVTQKHFAQTHRNAFLLRCDEFWNKQVFLRELLKQMGQDHGWQSLPDMMQTITNYMIQLDNPVIMIDEADKLRNDVLYLFISLYNRLEDHCGLVITATHHLSRRLDRGLKFNWKGYAEIWSRIGRRPVECNKTKAKDVRAICLANGVEQAEMVKQIIQESEGDLRRVKRAIHRINLMETAEA